MQMYQSRRGSMFLMWVRFVSPCLATASTQAAPMQVHVTAAGEVVAHGDGGKGIMRRSNTTSGEPPSAVDEDEQLRSVARVLTAIVESEVHVGRAGGHHSGATLKRLVKRLETELLPPALMRGGVAKEPLDNNRRAPLDSMDEDEHFVCVARDARELLKVLNLLQRLGKGEQFSVPATEPSGKDERLAGDVAALTEQPASPLKKRCRIEEHAEDGQLSASNVLGKMIERSEGRRQRHRNPFGSFFSSIKKTFHGIVKKVVKVAKTQGMAILKGAATAVMTGDPSALTDAVTNGLSAVKDTVMTEGTAAVQTIVEKAKAAKNHATTLGKAGIQSVLSIGDQAGQAIALGKMSPHAAIQKIEAAASQSITTGLTSISKTSVESSSTAVSAVQKMGSDAAGVTSSVDSGMSSGGLGSIVSGAANFATTMFR